MVTEALHRVLGHIEADLGPVGGDVRGIEGTAPGHRLSAHIAGVGPVFIKASDGSPTSSEAVAAEVALLMTLSHRNLPRVLAGDPLDEVPWMVQPLLPADGWTPPWPGRLKPVWAAIDAVSALEPPAWLHRAADLDPFEGLITTADLAGRHEDLQAAAARVSLAGEDLVHADLGGGNIHAAGRRVTLVDWSDAMIGNADLDRTSVAVDVAHEGGRRPAVPVADPGAWLAKTAGLLLAAAARPAWPGEGGMAVRAAQSDLAATALAWALEML